MSPTLVNGHCCGFTITVWMYMHVDKYRRGTQKSRDGRQCGIRIGAKFEKGKLLQHYVYVLIKIYILTLNCTLSSRNPSQPSYIHRTTINFCTNALRIAMNMKVLVK